MEFKVEESKVVGIVYTLKDEDGDILDQLEDDEVMYYIHGKNTIVPGLEHALFNRKVGDQVNVEISPENGYGEFDAELDISLERSMFPEDAEIEEGAQFALETDNGETKLFWMTHVTEDMIECSGNHPFAGRTLHFEIEVRDIRDATEDELASGYPEGSEFSSDESFTHC